MPVNISTEVSVDTTGIETMLAQLIPALGNIVDETLGNIEAEAKSLCPVDTGALRGSIHTVKESPISGSVEVGKEYGVYVEMGTVNMAAQPYLGPAFSHQTQGLGQKVADAVNKIKG